MHNSMSIIYEIRDFMIRRNLKYYNFKSSRFVFNQFPSPDGAVGFFLLCKKRDLQIDKKSFIKDLRYNNIIELIDLLSFDCQFSAINNLVSSNRLQEKFEDHTFKLLKKVDPKTDQTDSEQIN